MNKLLDIALLVGVAPLMCVGVYAFVDAVLVAGSAKIDGELVTLAQGGGEELFGRLDGESRYVVAWLMIDDTNINYPVVQGKNNSWFLSRNYKGEFATAGSLFLDYRNSPDFSDYFSVIYGHRMGNGEMFSDVQRFEDLTFFDTHIGGKLRVRGSDWPVLIVAYAEVRADDWSIYNVGKSHSDESAVRHVMDLSVRLREDVLADGYILLSTCDGSEKDKRDVLLVRLLH